MQEEGQGSVGGLLSPLTPPSPEPSAFISFLIRVLHMILREERVLKLKGK